MKTLTPWMLRLSLTLGALALACDDNGSGGDDGCDSANDSGNNSGNDSANDSGNNSGNSSNDSSNDSANDSGPTGGGVGDQCMSDADCSVDICLFAGDADYGFCSQLCDSFSDCPSFWDCATVGNASGTYCVPS